jgi:hypothetical protein
MNSAPRFRSSCAGEQPIGREDVDRKGGREPVSCAGACAGAALPPAMDWEQALAEAWTQASLMLEELGELGRYPRDLTEQEQDTDRLRMALAFLRARRKGFEDGVGSPSFRGQAANRYRPPSSRGETPEGSGAET